MLIRRKHYSDFKFCLEHERPDNKTLNAPLPVVKVTALAYAAGLGRTKMAKLLLDTGADIDLRSGEEGKTALHVASANGHSKTVDLLAKSDASVDAFDGDGRTPLWLAAYFDHPEVITALFENGADLNVADFSSITPAQAAASRGNVGALKALVRHGANLEGGGDEGFGGPPFFVEYLTPFRWAMAGNHTEAAVFLVESGAEINQIDVYTAAELDNVKLVLFLLDREEESQGQELVQSLMESSARTRSINVLRHFAQDGGKLASLIDWRVILLVSAYESFVGGIEVAMNAKRNNLGGNNIRRTLNQAMFIAIEG